MVAQYNTPDENMIAATDDEPRLIRPPRRGDNVKKWVNAPKEFKVPDYGYPTEAPPGTVEKLLVFIAREDRKESLFHPYDVKYEGDLRPLLFYLLLHERAEASRKEGE